MRKICGWMLAAALIVGLCACGQSAEAAWQEQYDLGVKYLDEGSYEEAIIAFTAAIDIDEKRPEAYIGRGGAYIGSGETADNLAAALADYEAALELDETLAAAWLGLADVYIRQGDYDRAMEILKEGYVKTSNEQILSALTKMEQYNKTENSGDTVKWNGDVNVALIIHSTRTGTLSLTGIEVQDAYFFDTAQLKNQHSRLIQWWITLHGAESTIAIWTGAFDWENGNDNTYTLEIADMQSGVSWYDQSGMDHTVSECNVAVTSDGLQWDFTVPAEFEGTQLPFDLHDISELEVTIYNANLGGLLYHNTHPIIQNNT